MILTYPIARIADIAEVKGGKRLPANASLVTTPTSHPYIRGRDIRNGKISTDDLLYVRDEDFVQIRRYTVNRGDVCITIVGNIGDIGITPTSLHGASLTENAVKLVNLRSDIDSQFLAFALMTPEAQSQMKLSAAGAAQAKLGIYKVNEIQVAVPPLPVQQRIAGILSAYDELIENSQRRIKILETMARALYREWFVHFRFPGFENHTRVASSLGDIPQGWEVKKLGELCSKLMDGTHDSPPPVEAGFPLITGRHIKGGFIDFSHAYQISPEEHQKVMKRSRPENGDIIYSNIGTLGATAIVDQDFEFTIKNVALLKPLTRAHSSFLYCYLESPEKLSELTSKASGTSQKFFSLQFLRTLELVGPPEALIEQFSEKLAPILRTRSLLMKGIQNLRRTRDLLLPRLLSGQVELASANDKETLA
jgi:type I restriction enzyme S subunit